MAQSIAVRIFMCVVTSNPTSNKKEKLTAGWGTVRNEKRLKWYVSLEMIMAMK